MSDGITPTHKYVVFGESSCNTTDSNYTYANALTLELMAILGEDERFLKCTQSDVINLSLVVLYGFLSTEPKDPICTRKLRDFIDDYDDFKKFALFTMNRSRQQNAGLNNEIDEIIRKEAL